MFKTSWFPGHHWNHLLLIKKKRIVLCFFFFFFFFFFVSYIFNHNNTHLNLLLKAHFKEWGNIEISDKEHETGKHFWVVGNPCNTMNLTPVPMSCFLSGVYQSEVQRWVEIEVSWYHALGGPHSYQNVNPMHSNIEWYGNKDSRVDSDKRVTVTPDDSILGLTIHCFILALHSKRR